MGMYDEKCECKNVAVEQRPETVFNLLGGILRLDKESAGYGYADKR